MIIGIVQGGLGNQFFCIAALKKFYILHPNNSVYIEKKYGFERNKKWKSKYEVDNFMDSQYITISMSHIFYKFLKIFSFFQIGNYSLVSFINEGNFFNCKKSIIYVLDGYFQELDYVGEMCLKKQPMAKIVCVHLRFYFNDNISVSKDDVNKSALKLINEGICISNENDMQLYIVTDNRIKVEEILERFNFELNVISSTTKHDFDLMASSSYLIFSGSTFSWWAAYIVHSNGGKVLYDEMLTGYRNTKTYFYEEWKLI